MAGLAAENSVGGGVDTPGVLALGGTGVGRTECRPRVDL